MNKQIDEKEIKKQLNDKELKAKELLEDGKKLDKFLAELETKLKKIPKLGNELSKVPVLINLVRDYKNKNYTEIPLLSIISILSALIYLLSPLDFIPDVIPGVGLTDDIAVILFVWKMVKIDVESYEEWKNGIKN